MGTPINHYLKGYVDDSRHGTIETLYKQSINSQDEVLASCELSPHDIHVLVERLYWTSMDGEATYHADGENPTLVIIYPFSRFWNVITDLFSIAQYSEEYSVALHRMLQEKLKLNDSRYPHGVRISFPARQVGEEFDHVEMQPHHLEVEAFECRAEIIAHATYIEGMLYKIITSSGKATLRQADNMKYHQKIAFCLSENLIPDESLIKIIKRLKNLRNEAAHQFSFERSGPDGDFLEVNPVSDKLLVGIKTFVGVCESRYLLKEGRINRFNNCLRMLAGELNKEAGISPRITLTKQYPPELSSYFYG